MNKALRVSLGTRLQLMADELAPDIQAEYIDHWLDKLEAPIDVALTAARVEGLEEAKQAIADSWLYVADPEGDIPFLKEEIDKLIKEAENAD